MLPNFMSGLLALPAIIKQANLGKTCQGHTTLFNISVSNE